ncbi:MAG: TPR repeat-containing protein YfgC precursor [candidate division BRC1 bacterium ADurb.BinA364]|nr:MAG: TPR repeat-containing protein YfgC precursor [candidate division BRC1 bacterium ADurb.BinA364]
MIANPIARNMALALVLALAAACATVPLTSRSQLAFIPDSQLLSLSQDNYKQILQESKISTDAANTAAVRRVGARLSQATESYLQAHGYSTASYKWEFNLIDDDSQQNAWCMPGGKVAVYSGILPICKDESGLAVVMSHEIAHAVARHGNERMSKQLIVELGGAALDKALAAQPEKTASLFLLSYGVASEYGVMMPYGRMQESEADRIGLILMAMAGFDPRAAAPFWERMAQAGGSRPPEFLSTHPAPATRIADIQRHLPEALQYYQPR